MACGQGFRDHRDTVAGHDESFSQSQNTKIGIGTPTVPDKNTRVFSKGHSQAVKQIGRGASRGRDRQCGGVAGPQILKPADKAILVGEGETAARGWAAKQDPT